MSKLARKPLVIPEGVEVRIDESVSPKILRFKGKLGEAALPILDFTNVAIEDKEIKIAATGKHKQARANWGTMASLTKSAMAGVASGFEKKLEFEGVGFRAEVSGRDLKLNLGFSHPVIFTPPAGVKVTVEKSIITVSGTDKALVGRVAAEIRKIKKPEPYKGTGIRYQGEVIRRKAGKKAATTAS